MALVVTSIDEGVGLIRLNRPEALNALSRQLILELINAIRTFDNKAEVRAMVVTGNDRIFCGMSADRLYVQSYLAVFSWRRYQGTERTHVR